MGGYYISSKSFLSISKSNEGVFKYNYKTYVSDQMYGTENKLMENSFGTLSNQVSDKKWKFKTGILLDKGSFIIVPEDNWEDYEPSFISVGHGFQRGSNQKFLRK